MEQARQQALQEQNYYATYPVNQLNAIRSGSQVQNPTFGSTPQGANYTGAAQNTYQAQLNSTNASNASSSAFLNGLLNLGSTAILGNGNGNNNNQNYSPYGGSPGYGSNGSYSDIRLKSYIVRVGTHRRGFGIYEYNIFGRRERGVIAQEVMQVMPEAVHMAPDGFLQVNYGAL